MANIIIKRCPVCPSIRSRVEEIVSRLREELHLTPRVEDGAKGELSVFVEGMPVIQRSGDDLPSPDEVEAAVQNAAPVGV